MYWRADEEDLGPKRTSHIVLKVKKRRREGHEGSEIYWLWVGVNLSS